ncbi:protein outspread-like isoform X2 [Limulus polyphemus]|uniref:Protein outspread-like isoform X2 n=1 Tax=Limulus polyphemus TaxID=6850 RepID=A0ABM1T391_LIMPO|nr:protein outspread-like isoform X2 [Limulus polyphemus]
MNKALEVSDGENVTGNQFSIAIATPDKVHFIKGTSKEERNWWFDILSRFPSNTIRGRNKRFATIPGGKATVTDVGNQVGKKSDISSDLIRSASTRERFNTFSSKFPSQPKPEPSWEQLKKAGTEDVFSTKESDKLILKNNLPSTPIKKASVINNKMESDNASEWKHIESKNLRNILSNSGSISYPSSVEKDTKTKKSLQVEETPNPDKDKPDENTDKGKIGVRRYLKRDGRSIRSQRSRSDGVAKMIPSPVTRDTDRKKHQNSFHLHTEKSILACTSEQETINQRIPLDKDCQEQSECDNQGLQQSESHTSFSPTKWQNQDKVRGDPDGCGLDFSHSGPLIHSESTPVDLFLKKGWLLRQGHNEWYKHWFVLRNSSLTFYLNPSAEESKNMDGILDLQLVKGVEEMETDKDHAFCITTTDNKKYVFAAITAGIRNNWIQAIDGAAKCVIPEMQKKGRTEGVTDIASRSKLGVISPVRDHDPVKLLDVSSSDDPSEYFSFVDEEELTEQLVSPRTLPPSPPLNRTAISKVKEKARSCSSSRYRAGKQLRSSAATDSEQNTCGMEVDQQSDGGISDRSSSSVHGKDSPYWEGRLSYRERMNKVLDDGNNNFDNKCVARLASPTPSLKNCCYSKETKDEDLAPKSLNVNDSKEELLEKKHRLPEELKSIKNSKEHQQKMSTGNSKDISDKNPEDKLEGKHQKQSESGENPYKSKYESLKLKYKKDRAEWEAKLFRKLSIPSKLGKAEELQGAIQNCKNQLMNVKCNLEKSPEKREESLVCWKEVSKLYEELEKLLGISERRSKKDNEISKLKNLKAELQGVCDDRQKEIERLKIELDIRKTDIIDLEKELRKVHAELEKLKDQTDLQGHVRNLETMLKNSICNSDGATTKQPDSFLLMENSELQVKLETVNEVVKSLKRKLNEADQNFDGLEINYFKLQQDIKRMQEDHSSQLALMTARVDDLTSKLTVSERNFRQTKQKLARNESRQERRKSSLRGKEGLNLSKEFERKIVDLEEKLGFIVYSLKESQDIKETEKPKSQIQPRSESPLTDTQNLLIRLNNLDTKVKNVSSLAGFSDQKIGQRDNLEKPKIFLQITNDSEESGPEEWKTLSLNNSFCDLGELEAEKNDKMQPQSLSECVHFISEKIQSLGFWFHNILYLLHTQGKEVDSSINKELKHLVKTIDNLSHNGFENTHINSDKRMLLDVVYRLIFFCEVVKAIDRLTDFDMSKRKDLIEEINHVSHWLSTLEKKWSSLEATSKEVNEEIKRTLFGFLKDFLLVKHRSDLVAAEQVDASCDGIQYDSFSITSELENIEEQFLHISEAFNTNRADNLSTLLSSLKNISDNELCEIQPLRCKEAFVTENRANQLSVKRTINEELLSENLLHVVTETCEKYLRLIAHQRNQQINLLHYDQESFDLWYNLIDKSLQKEQKIFSNELKTGLSKVESLHELELKCSLSQEILTKITDLANLTAFSGIIHGSIAYLKSKAEVVISNSKTRFNTQESSGIEEKQWITYLRDNLYQRVVLCVLPQTSHSCVAQVNEKCLENIAKQSASREANLQKCFHEDLTEEKSSYEQDLSQLQLTTLQQQQRQQFEEGCSTCQELREEICQLQAQLDIFQDSEQIMKQHQEEIESLKSNHLAEVEAIKKEMRELIEKQDKLHTENISELQSELQLSQKHLKYLELEHEEQMKSIIESYHHKLETKHDVISEEAIRRRYQSEIEQWKGLSEKGLIAMENSYKRMISDMQKKHQMELKQLENEKEKVLAEEIQATRAALDAMRKAHKEELQREIAKFKEEFFKQTERPCNVESQYKEHEAELEEIKQEILALCEKYSIKCLENASLKENLEMLSKQLENTSYQVFDLIARNKQLQAMLTSEVAEKKKEVSQDNDNKNLERLKKEKRTVVDTKGQRQALPLTVIPVRSSGTFSRRTFESKPR